MIGAAGYTFPLGVDWGNVMRRIALWTVPIGLGALVALNLDDMRRYMKIHRM
jgi:hypothetical protein